MTQPAVTGQWFWGVGDQKNGPVSLPDLQAMVRSGQLGPQAMVWTEGMPAWVPAGNLPVLFPKTGMSRAEENALGLLVPVGAQSGVSIAAGYLGILGFIPLLAPVGVILGILGVMDLKKHPEKHGWGRALTGIIAGGLFTLGWAALFVIPIFTRR
jgi:hypothetical protein